MERRRSVKRCTSVATVVWLCALRVSAFALTCTIHSHTHMHTHTYTHVRAWRGVRRFGAAERYGDGVDVSVYGEKALVDTFTPSHPTTPLYTTPHHHTMGTRTPHAKTFTRADAKVKTQHVNETAKGAIDGYWSELSPHVCYLSMDDVQRVHFALKVSYYAHDGQYRKSGEPFIVHPVAVAGLLGDLGMDTDTVIAGLLHDTVEDTDLTFEQVETLFGAAVRQIVEGETKVSKLPKLAMAGGKGKATGKGMDMQAENLRQMFIAMSEDFRIIIVKLADRLHNMRTLTHMPRHKQLSISRETLDIFAPLAHRLGIWQFKSELEDTAFRYLNPDHHTVLQSELNQHGSRFRKTLEGSRWELESIMRSDTMLAEQDVTIAVTGRMKELYPLWLKMQEKGQFSVKELADVVALRVVLDLRQRPGEPTDEWKTRGVWLCYHVLGLVQHLPNCQPVPSQVKDYISFPKPNGYQSLHTSIMHGGQRVEVQIRTNWMHSIAEYGMAAHWLYKDSRYGHSSAVQLFDKYQVAWMKTIQEWQDEIHNSTEFVDTIRRELLGKRVFVFLRDGKILNLSRGATVVDAAFAIHTEIGLKMSAAQINGQYMPLSYELQNGDVICIMTTDDAKPNAQWMKFARSRSTRAKLRTHFRKEERSALVHKGWLYVHDFMQQHSDLIHSQLGHTPTDEELKLLMRRNYKDERAFLMKAAKETDAAVLRAMLSQLFSLRYEQVGEVRTTAHRTPVRLRRVVSMRARARGASRIPTSISSSDTMRDGTIRAGSGGATRDRGLCSRCMPVHNDKIVAATDYESGNVLVHRASCPELGPDVERVEASWIDTPPGFFFVSEVQAFCSDRKYLLRDVSDAVASMVDIQETTSHKIGDRAMLHFKVEVEDVNHLERLLVAVRAVAGVESCERITASPGLDG